MKSSFSLLELIIVIVVLAILSGFAINRYLNSTSFAQKVKIKSEIALIRNSIDKINNKNILNDEKSITSLDDAKIEKNNSKLFSKVLEFPFVSSCTNDKEIGKWIKTSLNRYKIYFSNNEYLEFSFQNLSFKCISDKNLCKEFE